MTWGRRATQSNGYCDAMLELLSAYIDGEVTTDERITVDGHVATCGECAYDLAFLRQTAELLDNTPEVLPPAALRDSILNATVFRPTLRDRALYAARQWLVPTPARIGGLVAAAAALALFAVLMNSDHATAPQPVAFYQDRHDSVASSPKQASPQAVAQSPENPVQDNENVPAISDPREDAPVLRDRVAPPQERSVQTASTTETDGPKTASIRPAVSRGTKRAVSPAVLRTARSTPVFKAKLRTVTVPQNEEIKPDAMPDSMTMMADAGMMHGNGGMMDSGMASSATAAAEPHNEPVVVKLVAASSTTVDAGQVASLADLKRALRRQNADVMSAKPFQPGPRSREIRLDVIRASF